MKITLDKFCKSFGDTKVIEELDLEIHDGEMIALLGPSGCGKTTTLFSICGIHQVSGGRILFGDKEIHNLPPQERNVGVVFQSYALYPHLTVFENIAFPLRINKDSAAFIDSKVKEFAGIVQIDHLLDRKPAQLSGGQQQRVALARALVRTPQALLLDEPLSNLDSKLRLEMRSKIRRIQQDMNTTAILVTHDQVEAMSMCDRIALMDQGKIQQIGKPEEIYAQPNNRFVANFIGNPPICFSEGNVNGSTFRNDFFEFELSTTLLDRFNKLSNNNQSVALGIRPEYLMPSFGNFVSGRVSFVEPQGRETLYDITLSDNSILRSIQPGKQKFELGQDISWGLDPENILLFDSEGLRI